jgi:hypothetical protein
MIGQSKQNRLAEKRNLKESMPFMVDKRGQKFASENALFDSLDEELFEELEPEVIKYLMQEFNGGQYDPHLV